MRDAHSPEAAPPPPPAVPGATSAHALCRLWQSPAARWTEGGWVEFESGQAWVQGRGGLWLGVMLEWGVWGIRASQGLGPMADQRMPMSGRERPERRGRGCREGEPLDRPGLFLVCPDGDSCGVIRPGSASFTHPQLRGVLLLATSQCLPVRRPQ